MWLETNICNANTQHGMKGFKIMMDTVIILDDMQIPTNYSFSQTNKK
jgi:hypothetical protein